MLYFRKAALVILATPKTGSTALAQALAPRADIVLQNNPDLKHCTFQRYKWRMEKFIQIFDETPPQTTALIRHPEDWLGSWFRFRQRPALDGTSRSTRGLSFDDFVTDYLGTPQPEFARVGRQARFLTHPQTGQVVDHLFRYEAMSDFVIFLSSRLGMPVILDRLNTSPVQGLTLSTQIRQRLERDLPEDYALYEAARTQAAD